MYMIRYPNSVMREIELVKLVKQAFCPCCMKAVFASLLVSLHNKGLAAPPFPIKDLLYASRHNGHLHVTRGSTTLTLEAIELIRND